MTDEKSFDDWWKEQFCDRNVHHQSLVISEDDDVIIYRCGICGEIITEIKSDT